jgi:two-component system LytT family sensor kinase
MEYDNDKIIRPAYRIEIFYWTVLAVFSPVFNSLVFFPNDWKFWPLLLMISLLLLPAYIVYARIILPRVLFPRHYLVFIFSSVNFVILLQLIIYGLYQLFHFQSPLAAKAYFAPTVATVARESLWTILNMCMAIAITFIRKALDEKYLIEDLWKDNINFKLKYLRSQLNPHFLFNTLNSIYSLSLQKSDKTPEVVVRLADIMRYLVDDCNEPRIALDKEIEFIRNYIEIEKIRFQADIRFEVEGETRGVMIEPYLFISFIENGFKHALHSESERPYIYITLTCGGGQVALTVVNNTHMDLETQAKKVQGTGIRNSKLLLELLYPGSYALDIIQTEKKERRKSITRLKNARERLKLLYPDTHTLDVILNHNSFTVSLILNPGAR